MEKERERERERGEREREREGSERVSNSAFQKQPMTVIVSTH